MKKDVFIRRDFGLDQENKFCVDSSECPVQVSLIFYIPVMEKIGWYLCAYAIEKNGVVVREFSVEGLDGVNALTRAFRSSVVDLQTGYPEWFKAIPSYFLEDLVGRRLHGDADP